MRWASLTAVAFAIAAGKVALLSVAALAAVIGPAAGQALPGGLPRLDAIGLREDLR